MSWDAMFAQADDTKWHASHDQFLNVRDCETKLVIFILLLYFILLYYIIFYIYYLMLLVSIQFLYLMIK